MRHILFFMGLFILVLAEPLQAQQRKISTSDEFNIRTKAQKLITNLAYQYNQIISSNSDERTILIRNLTSRVDNGFPPFIDDQVIIEDDFTTIGNFPKDERDRSVDMYFQNIGLYYGKSDNGDFLNQNKEVEFRNITYSKIMLSSTKDSLYIKIYFDVKYDGIDKRTRKTFVKPCHRVSELQAHKINGIWRVFITSLSFYNPSKEIDNSKNVLVINNNSTILEDPQVEDLYSSKEKGKNNSKKASPINNNSTILETLQADLSSSKSKKVVFKILGLGALGAAAGIFAVANGKYSDYVAKVEKNNTTYTDWYRANLNGQLPPSDELAKPVSMSEYTSPSIVPIGGAVALGLGLFLWGNKYGKIARETKTKIEAIQKNAAFTPKLDIFSGRVGFNISYKF